MACGRCKARRNLPARRAALLALPPRAPGARRRVASPPGSPSFRRERVAPHAVDHRARSLPAGSPRSLAWPPDDSRHSQDFFLFFFPTLPQSSSKGGVPATAGVGPLPPRRRHGPPGDARETMARRARTHARTHAPPRGLFQGTLLAGVGERQAVHRQHGERGAGDACRGTYERAVGHTRGSSGGNTRRQRVPLRPPPPPVSASVSALCFCVALSLCPRLTFRCSAGPLAPSLHTP